MTTAFIYDYVRTPFGRYGGALAGVRPDDLAAHVVGEQVRRSPDLDPALIDDVILGNANGAGEDNRNVARMAALLAGLPVTVPGTTINRLCGSSLDAAIQASRAIETGDADVILAGGVESMSRAPWVALKPERAFPAQDTALVSTTLGWRLVNPRMRDEWTVSLGEATERLAERYNVSRERQDEFAVSSHSRAKQAWESGHYVDLVTPVPHTELVIDEAIRSDTSVEKLATLTTVFRPNGTVTAGNASPLNDGASAMLIGSEKASDLTGRAPIARIVARAAVANDPQYFGFAPVEAANKALERASLTWADIDAVELNEAFAAQALACIDAWKVDPAIVNAWGGAVAIGHPLGASGTRVLATVAERLRVSGERWGVAAICIGVGQGLAVVVENVS